MRPEVGSHKIRVTLHFQVDLIVSAVFASCGATCTVAFLTV